MKTSCLTPRISANMFPAYQNNPPKILNNKSGPCQSLTHQINVMKRADSQPSSRLSESAELTTACNFCRGVGITSLFRLLIKVKQIHKFCSQVVQALKCGSYPCPVSSSSSNKCHPSASPSTDPPAPAATARDNPNPKGEGQLHPPPTWGPSTGWRDHR